VPQSGCSCQIGALTPGSTYTVGIACKAYDTHDYVESTTSWSAPFTVPVAGNDDDGDDLTNAHEWTHGTDPLKADSDGDLLPDGWEHDNQMNPTNADADADGISDGEEDADGDALSNLREFQNGSNPTSKDSDGDGISDATEAFQGSDPTDPGDSVQSLPYDMVATIGMLVSGGPDIPGFSDVWSLNVGDKTCTMPNSKTDGYAQYQFPTGGTYDVTVEHVGTIGPNYGWGADVHLLEGAQGILDNEGGPLGAHATIEPASSDPTGMLAKLHLFQLDADIDSNNDSGFTPPVNDTAEDWTELDSTTGKVIWANTGDVNHNGIVDTKDFGAIANAHFVPMVVRLSQSVNAAISYTDKVSFKYDSTILRIWKPGKDASVARTTSDIIPSETPISASDLGLFPGTGGNVTVFVEAIKGCAAPLPIEVAVEVDGSKWSGTLTDTVHVVVGPIVLATGDTDAVEGSDADAISIKMLRAQGSLASDLNVQFQIPWSTSTDAGLAPADFVGYSPLNPLSIFLEGDVRLVNVSVPVGGTYTVTYEVTIPAGQPFSDPIVLKAVKDTVGGEQYLERTSLSVLPVADQYQVTPEDLDAYTWLDIKVFEGLTRLYPFTETRECWAFRAV
jgi:hypothetical protein